MEGRGQQAQRYPSRQCRRRRWHEYWSTPKGLTALDESFERLEELDPAGAIVLSPLDGEIAQHRRCGADDGSFGVGFDTGVVGGRGGMSVFW